MGLSPGPRSGRYTIAVSNTVERLSATSVPCESVALKKLSGGTVTVGDENLDANGWTLTEPIAMDVNDVRSVRVYGTAGDIILWIVTRAG